MSNLNVGLPTQLYKESTMCECFLILVMVMFSAYPANIFMKQYNARLKEDLCSRQ